jgi:uncharacterized repeat protein (TIGR03803 family)
MAAPIPMARSSTGVRFKITTTGQLATLYSFCAQPNCADGSNPSQLVQGKGLNFSGSTAGGGADGKGTAFEVTQGGQLTTLYSFGISPVALMQGTDAKFYGTTNRGGTSDDGTLFSLAAGLGPFVETLPTSGNVGATVKILGTKLTGATSVSFNGTSATFTVVSGSEITATVPAGRNHRQGRGHNPRTQALNQHTLPDNEVMF